MCGEMAAEPVFTLVLLGLGLDEFSASAVAVPEIKKIIRSVNFEQAQEMATKILQLESAEEIQKFASTKLNELIMNNKK